MLLSKTFIVLLIFLSFFFLGCINKDITKLSYQGSFDKLMMEDITPLSSCEVFVCENKSGITQLFWKAFSAINIADERPPLDTCNFERFDLRDEAAKAKFMKLMEENLSKSRFFMIGQGPSIAAADEARKYCLGFQGFSIQWLGGDRTRLPRNISSNAVVCSTESDMIPLLAYGIKDGDLEYTINLAESLKKKGPVFIAPGALFSKKDKLVNDPSCDFAIIKNRCTNCLTSAFIRFGDESAMQWFGQKQNVLSTASECSSSFVPIEKIDVVVIDVNLNDFECKGDQAYSDISEFIENISKKYQKPMMLNIRASEGSGKDGCTWTKEEIDIAFSTIYKTTPTLVHYGVIGIANSDLSSLYSQGKQGQLFKSWFNGCREYYNPKAEESPLIFSIYPRGNSEYITCGDYYPNQLMRNYEQLDTTDLEFNPIINKSFCDNCFDLDYTDLSKYTTLSLPESDKLSETERLKYCDSWNGPIRAFAGQFGYDPSVVRSIIHSDNDFIKLLKPNEQSKFGECEIYSGETKDMCIGTEILSYYLQEARSKLPSGTKENILTYFSVLGYKTNEQNFLSEIALYKTNPNNLIFNSLAIRIVANSEEIRKACGMCS